MSEIIDLTIEENTGQHQATATAEPPELVEIDDSDDDTPVPAPAGIQRPVSCTRKRMQAPRMSFPLSRDAAPSTAMAEQSTSSSEGKQNRSEKAFFVTSVQHMAALSYDG